MNRVPPVVVSCLLVLSGALVHPRPVRSETLAEKEKEALFLQANDFFHQASEAAPSDPARAADLYEKALRRFERIVRDGEVRNGKLYYDIGNTYFRLDDLGRAILYYLRAGRLMPNDPNLLQNLAYARSLRHDKIEEKPQTRVLKTLLFWHYDLAARTRSIVFAAFFAVFWLGATVRLFAPRFMPRWILGVVACVAISFCASIVTEQVLKARTRPGVIVAAETVARKGDGASYEPAFNEPLHAGTEFRLVEDREGWLQIELADGRRCWVPRSAAELV